MAFQRGKFIWWQRPHMRTDADMALERKASWLELFWDLIFVAVMAELSHYIVHHYHGFSGILSFIILFVPIWWIWNGITFYNERYEVNNVRHRVIMFITIVPIAGMAYSIHGALGPLANTYALSNVAARLILAYLWMTAARTDLQKLLSAHFSVGLCISSVFFIASVFASPNYRQLLWALASIADLASPLFSLNIQAKLPRISTSHLPERFGLLIILTLGESFISSIRGLTELEHMSLLTVIISTASLLIIFLVWWLYIDHVMYRTFKPKMFYALSWCYLHLPLSIAIIALSASISIITTTFYSGPWTHVPMEMQWILVMFVVATLVVMILLNLVSETTAREHNGVVDFHHITERDLVKYKLIAIAFIVISILLLGKFLAPVYLMLIISAGLFIPVVQGLYVWVKGHTVKDIEDEPDTPLI